MFAALARDAVGDAARLILSKLQQIDAKTCCLTIDELAWVVFKKVDNATAVKACRAVLALKDLEIVSIEYGDLWIMTDVMTKFQLRPRDALHLAVMKRLDEKAIVTEDSHFDAVGVNRMAIQAFAKSF